MATRYGEKPKGNRCRKTKGNSFPGILQETIDWNHFIIILFLYLIYNLLIGMISVSCFKILWVSFGKQHLDHMNVWKSQSWCFKRTTVYNYWLDSRAKSVLLDSGTGLLSEKPVYNCFLIHVHNIHLHFFQKISIYLKPCSTHMPIICLKNKNLHYSFIKQFLLLRYCEQPLLTSRSHDLLNQWK